jgi:hypothetical protein
MVIAVIMLDWWSVKKQFENPSSSKTSDYTRGRVIRRQMQRIAVVLVVGQGERAVPASPLSHLLSKLPGGEREGADSMLAKRDPEVEEPVRHQTRDTPRNVLSSHVPPSG